MKYRIFLVESERDWGQNRWHEDYDTYEEAKERIRSVNAANVTLRASDWYMQARAPDWYIQADDRIEVVE